MEVYEKSVSVGEERKVATYNIQLTRSAIIELDYPTLCKTTRREAELHRSHNTVNVDHLSHRGTWGRKAVTTVTTYGGLKDYGSIPWTYPARQYKCPTPV